MEARAARRVEIDGDAVAWNVLGDGPPVVLVHGFPGNSFAWRRIAPELARTRTVYLYDLLGCGASAKREGQLVAPEAQARLLGRLLDAWQLEEPDVVAHDVGSPIALAAHLFGGRRFPRLVLLDPATLNPSISRNSLHVRAYPDAYKTMPAPIFAGMLSTQIRSTMHGSMPDDVFDAYFRPWRDEGQPAYVRFIEQLDESFLDRIERALPQVAADVTIVWGEKDTWLPVEHREKLRSLIPRARLELVPDAGHFVMEDAPDRVLELVRGALG